MDASILVALIGVFSAVLGSYLAYERGKTTAKDELQIEYDKNLRAERIESYRQVMKLMRNLPKYPEPIVLSYDELRNLSLYFTNWYYNEGGGLFLSTPSRECYFDLQDGIKIALKLKAGQWEQISEKKKLLKELGRNDDWKCPDALMDMAKSNSDVSGDKVAPTLLEYVRRLASTLRTSITDDVMTRKSTLLQSRDRL